MSDRRITLRPRALADINGIVAYITPHHPRAAQAVADAILAACDLLAAMPRMGTLRRARSPRLEGLRSWPVRRYRRYIIFYLPTADGIDVVRVLHGARDVQKIIDEED